MLVMQETFLEAEKSCWTHTRLAGF